MRTLSRPSRLETEVKRSRFVAHAGRVDTLADTLTFFESVADPTATHNCWAWKLGNAYRFNDDGEPASTAGKPILGVIEGKGLDHVMIVVTRYFGGIKLGAGGLARAYSGAAARCLDRASAEEIHAELECTIEADFCWTGQLYAALESLRAQKMDERFADGGIFLRARVRESAFEALRVLLRETTRGEARIRKLG
jgi:uncharacterized YigZ family protein